jgi:hypothetical protein
MIDDYIPRRKKPSYAECKNAEMQEECQRAKDKADSKEERE